MSQLWPALSIAQREINLKQKINVRMTANDSDSEKAPATTETMTKKDERPPPPVSSKDTDDRHYLCGCKNWYVLCFSRYPTVTQQHVTQLCHNHEYANVVLRIPFQMNVCSLQWASIGVS